MRATKQQIEKITKIAKELLPDCVKNEFDDQEAEFVFDCVGDKETDIRNWFNN